MEKLKLFVDAIEDRYSQVDAMQIAEALWLSQYMDSYPTQKDESSQDETPIPNDALPKEVTHTVNISHQPTPPTPKRPNPNLPKVGFDKTNNSTAYYSTYVEAYRKRTNIAQKFRKLRIKQKTTSTHEIDEERTAQYIADCGLFHPIFEETKSYQKALHLKIIIDKAPSMFLWSGRVEEFIKSFENTQIFKGVTCYELHSDGGDTPMLTRCKSNKKIPYTSVLFKREDELMLVLSDIVGKHWRSAKMFDTLALWSRYHFVAIISMLPKRMWERTPLRWGSTLLTKSKKPFPKNRDLHLEYPTLENRLSDSLKIPVIPYDEDAFEHLSSVIASHKNSQIETRIFASIDEKIKSAQRSNNTPPPSLTPKERVENFFASAPPSARALAIYTSVLPLHERIIKELIKLKKLGRGIDAFVEFYFGGLIKGDMNPEVGTYQFHDGVAKILREYITLEDARELFWMLDGVIKSSLGVTKGLIDLLYIDKSPTAIDYTPQEKALVEFLIEILGDMGHQTNRWEDTINPPHHPPPNQILPHGFKRSR